MILSAILPSRRSINACSEFYALIRTATVALALLSGMGGSVHAQDIFYVNSGQDLDNLNPGDGSCDATGTIEYVCTLRSAIEEANTDADRDTIAFSFPSLSPSGETNYGNITLGFGGMPDELEITEPVIIDGTTNDNYPSTPANGPVVALSGTQISTSGFDGLTIQAEDVTIRGLAINNFTDEAIDVSPTATGVTIVDCFIGLDMQDGESDSGNLRDPDGTDDAALDVTGDEFTIRNTVVSHNGGTGIRVAASDGSINNTYVGVDVDGTSDRGNAGTGLHISSGNNNVVGIGNVFSGNDEYGVKIDGTNNDLTLGNFIGTNSSGTSTIGNDSDGIKITNDGNTIAANVIGGNGGHGIVIGSDSRSADNVTVLDNFIGVATDEMTDLANDESGIYQQLGAGTSIRDNVIGFNNYGITIEGVNPTTSNRTSIRDNYIGANSDGGDIGHNWDGITINAEIDNSSQEVEVFGENVIGYNGNHGINVSSGAHDISGNYIGTNPSGEDLGNGEYGIEILADGASVGNIGIDVDADENAPNVIGFNSHGIDIRGDNNRVSGNYVGTDAAGSDLANNGAGIAIYAPSEPVQNNVIGYDVTQPIPADASPANGNAGNHIAHNAWHGVAVFGSEDPHNNTIRGNLITDNGSKGISLGGADGNDAGDGDDGSNFGQNHPVISSVSNCDDGASPTTVDISFQVRSNPGGEPFSEYPLTVDFYVADSESGGEGSEHIQTVEVSAADASSQVSTTLSTDMSCNNYFVATATDNRGNTSEFFSPSRQLPVELASFKARQTGSQSIELTWTTASERNNAGFHVQRQVSDETSRASGTWRTLGTVEGAGTTDQTQRYRFTASDLSAGTHEFRLRQIDLDGTSHLHDPVTVELSMEQALRLSAPAPNPSSEAARLSFAVRDKATTTGALYNTLGQRVAVVYRGTPPPGEQQTLTVSTSDLSSGTYFLRMTTGQRSKTRQLVVVR